MPGTNLIQNISVKKNDFRQDKLILQSIAEGICVVNKDEKIVFSNFAADQMFGGSPAEIEDKFYEEVFFCREKGTLKFCPIRFALQEGETFHVKTETFFTLGGSEFLVEYICVPLIENNEINGVVITFEDITERSEIARAIDEARNTALENARARAAFLANMSHEIRTPLNGIIGAANLLSETNLDEKQENYAEMLKTSAGLLLEIVNDILDFSKIEAGKLHLEIAEFDFYQLITDTANLFKSLAGKKNLKFEFAVDKNIPKKLSGDDGKLRQILNNLLSNAVKFTKAGEIYLKVYLKKEYDEKIILSFDIFDTGIGIDSQKINDLFQPFVQADVSTTRQFGGTGLGLAICKEIVEKMGGEIGVESLSGSGSQFWFTAEFGRSSEDSQNRPVSAKESHGNNFSLSEDRQISTLIVEDNAVNRTITSELLEQLGIKAEFAENGIEALQKNREKPFDLILMDCRMPEMDGFEASRAILEQSSETKKPKIIALTASSTEDEKERCFASGMVGFLTKPIEKNDLIKELDKYFAAETSLQNLDLKKNLVQHSFSEIISDATLEKLLEIEARGKKDFIAEMLDLYCEHIENGLAEIKTAAAEKNVSVILQKAHGLKGSSANMGTVEMCSLFERLEEETKKKNWTRIEQIIAETEHQFGFIKKLLKK